MPPVLPSNGNKTDSDAEPQKTSLKELAGKESGILPSEIIRSEVNFLILPFFALWSKDLKRKTKTEYKTAIRRGSQKLEISWTVTSNSELGYPGPFDRLVHKAIEQTMNELPTPIQNPIPLGSIYKLINRMGLETRGGQIYRKIKEALQRIALTGIISKGTYYSKREEQWIEDTFHLYERVVFKGRRLPNGEIADTNYLYLNSWYLDNINARYVKPIDWSYYKSLETPIAQRLYELLSVKFYGLVASSGKFISYKYSTLCDLLPITQQQYFSKAGKILEPAHKKLKETGFLEDWSWEELPRKENGKDWLIRYYPGERAKGEIKRFRVGEQLELEMPPLGEQKAVKDEAELSVEESNIIEQLTQRGITGVTARKLARAYPTEQIHRQIEVFDWLKGRKSLLIGKNPAGFLRKSIEEDYQPPEEYRSHREREARKLEEERMMAQKRAEEEERERELARIKAYKDNLSHEERAKLREKAEAEVRNSGQYKEEFITEYLIEAEENELIRAQMGQIRFAKPSRREDL